MKKFYAAFLAATVAACNQSTISPEVPNYDCQNVWDKATAQGVGANADVKVKRSHEMELAASLACYYGAANARAQINCSIPVDETPLFDEDKNDTGELHDKSSAFLIASETVGHHMEYQEATALAAAGYSSKDSDKCLQAIHDIPKSRESLRKYFQTLRKLGY
jgi:hypothetical protein